MITPLAGVQDVVSLLDDVVSARPHLPPLVLVTTSTPRDDSRAFLDGYRERLSDIRHRSLVPHAHSSETVLALARGHDQPDVTLLDQLASQFRSTIPRARASGGVPGGSPSASTSSRSPRTSASLGRSTAGSSCSTGSTRAGRPAVRCCPGCTGRPRPRSTRPSSSAWC